MYLITCIFNYLQLNDFKSLILHKTIHSEFKPLKFSIQICRIENFPTPIHYIQIYQKRK